MQKSAQRKNAKRLGTNWGEEDGVDGSQGSSPGEKCPLSQQEPCRHPTWTGAQREIGGNRLAGKHREGIWKQHSQKVRQIFGSHFFISLKPPHEFLQGTIVAVVWMGKGMRVWGGGGGCFSGHTFQHLLNFKVVPVMPT